MRAFSFFAMMTLLSGCTRFEHVSPPAALGRRLLEVRFATPIELVGRTPDGAEVVRSRVEWIAGRPLEVRNDSLVLEVRRWVSAEDWPRTSRPFVAAVPTKDACVDMGNRKFSGRRTAAVVLAVPVTAYVLLLLFCAGRAGCDPLY